MLGILDVLHAYIAQDYASPSLTLSARMQAVTVDPAFPFDSIHSNVSNCEMQRKEVRFYEYLNTTVPDLI
jgi:hypothetical protein